MNPNYFYNLYKNQIWYLELSLVGVASICLFFAGLIFSKLPVEEYWVGVSWFLCGMYLLANFLDMIVEHDETIQSQINHDRKQMQNLEKNRRRVPVIYE